MKFELDSAGKTLTVEVEVSGSELRVRIDGRERSVEAHWSSPRELLLRIDGRVHDLQLWPAGPSDHEVLVGGRRLRVGVSGDASASGVAGARPVHGGVVLAPMPGKVVAVLVEAGDEVAAGQGLVVVEAMKMENELAAPGPGRVKAVRVRAGQIVEGGQPLVEIG